MDFCVFFKKKKSEVTVSSCGNSRRVCLNLQAPNILNNRGVNEI